MAQLSDFGIVSIGTALTRRFKLRTMVEVPEPVLNEAGEFRQNATYGAGDYTFDAEGAGDLPGDFAIGGGGPAIDGLTGGVSLVLRVGEKQSLGRHNEWTASGEHAANAS